MARPPETVADLERLARGGLGLSVGSSGVWRGEREVKMDERRG